MRFIGIDFFALDLLAIGTAFLFLNFGRTGSCIFALSQGIFIDLFSGGTNGLYTILYIGVFGGIWIGSTFFDLQAPKGQIIIVFFALLLKNILFFGLVAGATQDVYFSKSFFWDQGIMAAITGLLAPALIFVLDRLKTALLEESSQPSKEHL